LESRVPGKWRGEVHILYEQVKAKARTQGGMSRRFNENNGVKKGYALCCKLFKLCIEKLEQWVNEKVVSVYITCIIIKILPYVIGIILTKNTINSLQKHLQELKIFYKEVGVELKNEAIKVMEEYNFSH